MKYKLMVEGMSCSHCENAVKNALLTLSNISEVEIDLNTGEVRMFADADAKLIQSTIEDQGYDVVSIEALN